MENTILVDSLRVGDSPAPGKLILIEGFLNTWSGELDIDDFKTPRSTEEWLRAVGLWKSKKHISQEQTKKLIKTRSALREWVLESESSQLLNTLVSEISYKAEFSADKEVKFTPPSDPYHTVVGTLVEIIYESRMNGTWDRFKCCALPTCGWAFYDSTRSRTKRWCSMRTCGSRHKSREHYKRKTHNDNL